jgi:uncharacterized protein
MSVHDPRHAHPLDSHGDPLTFAVSGLLADVPGTVREYVIDAVEVDPGDGLLVTEPVSGTMRLLRTNRGLVVEARLRTALAGECARCVRPLVVPIAFRIDEEVLPTIDLGSGLPVPVEEDADPEAPRLTDHHELEFRPLVLEAISLQEPIAPLCGPDCPGLCHECGERLEVGHPDHGAQIDPRLEALLAFRVDGEAETG